MSGIVNKVKEAISGDHHSSNTSHTTTTSHTTSHGVPEGTHGPHSGRVANAADPRFDSDMDNRANPNSAVGGTHGYAGGNNYTHSGAGTTGTTGTTGHSTTHGTTGHGTTGHGTTGYGSTGQTTSGPHRSDLANKADPRIDSDRDGRFAGNTAGDHYGSGREGAAGPHNSRIGNTVDPRVDSDRDGSRTAGNTYGSSGTAGTTGAGYGQTAPSGNTYGSSTGPGYGSTTGTTGTTGTHGHGLTGHSGPGPAPNTAGPHKSDMANKVDPRVDSDLDHSKTFGGNKTYQQ